MEEAIQPGALLERAAAVAIVGARMALIEINDILMHWDTGCDYQKPSSLRARTARTRYLAILRISASGSGSS